jgi:hypothetical protein
LSRLLPRKSALVFFLCLAALPAASQPQPVRLGAYVARLGDFDPASGTFTADVWLWTHAPESANLDVIRTLGPWRTKELTFGMTNSTVKNGTVWGMKQFRAKIEHDWDMRRFPFDHHTLVIPLGETDYDARRVVFVPDHAGSSLDPHLNLSDWKITGFRVETSVTTLNSTFGDPSANARKSDWPEARILITVARKGLGAFVKVTFVAYVAFVMLMMSLLLPIDAFSDRLNMLLGSLFAVAVNLRGAESLLGASDNFNFVDLLHMIITLAILLATAMLLASRRFEPDRARRVSSWTAAFIAMVFVATNGIIVYAALAS